MELRFTLNARVDANSNISIAVSHIVTTEAEADEAGCEARKMVDAYIAGYDRGQ
jgi:hypothetical protein